MRHFRSLLVLQTVLTKDNICHSGHWFSLLSGQQRHGGGYLLGSVIDGRGSACASEEWERQLLDRTLSGHIDN